MLVLKGLVGLHRTVQHGLGLEPMCMGLKPSQNPWYLVSDNEAQILDVSWQKEFSERESDK